MRINQEQTIDRCRFCFMCRHVCSAARSTHQESITPRSQGLVLSLINRDAAAAGPDVIANLYDCTQCRWCKEWCEGGWDFSVCVIAARQALLDAGLVPPAVQDRLERLRAQQVKPVAGADILILAEPTWAEAAPAQTAQAVKLLRQAGLSVRSTDDPSPALALYLLGDQTSAARHLEQLITVIRDSACRTVCVLSPGDAFLLQELPAILQTRALPAELRVCTLADLLLDSLAAGTLKARAQAETWTWQDDDFSARYTHQTEALPALLRALPGVAVAAPAWHGRLARSCGGASMGCGEPGLIAQLAALRMQELRETGASGIVTMTADDAALLSAAGGGAIAVLTLADYLAGIMEDRS
jgi:Fe-S oxidoreductase